MQDPDYRPLRSAGIWFVVSLCCWNVSFHATWIGPIVLWACAAAITMGYSLYKALEFWFLNEFDA